VRSRWSPVWHGTGSSSICIAETIPRLRPKGLVVLGEGQPASRAMAPCRFAFACVS
jgi:hypothetical protein